MKAFAVFADRVAESERSDGPEIEDTAMSIGAFPLVRPRHPVVVRNGSKNLNDCPARKPSGADESSTICAGNAIPRRAISRQTASIAAA